VDLLTSLKAHKGTKKVKGGLVRRLSKKTEDDQLKLLFYASLELETRGRKGGSEPKATSPNESEVSGILPVRANCKCSLLILEIVKISPQDVELRNQGRMCYNSLCRSTPQDRLGWHEHSLQKGKKICFCGKCDSVYASGEFCFWCHQIYLDSADFDDGLPWMQCDGCNRWTHNECERQHGELPRDIFNGSFFCATCREDKIQSERNVKRKQRRK
jgi:hypothetical protein